MTKSRNTIDDLLSKYIILFTDSHVKFNLIFLGFYLNLKI